MTGSQKIACTLTSYAEHCSYASDFRVLRTSGPDATADSDERALCSRVNLFRSIPLVDASVVDVRMSEVVSDVLDA